MRRKKRRKYSFRAWEDDVILANKSDKNKYKPSLFRATWKIYGKRYFVIGAFLFIYVCRVYTREKEIKNQRFIYLFSLRQYAGLFNHLY